MGGLPVDILLFGVVIVAICGCKGIKIDLWDHDDYDD